MENPRIGYLVNCARVLGIKQEDLLAELFEPEWLEWFPFNLSEAAEPPADPSELWHGGAKR